MNKEPKKPRLPLCLCGKGLRNKLFRIAHSSLNWWIVFGTFPTAKQMRAYECFAYNANRYAFSQDQKRIDQRTMKRKEWYLYYKHKRLEKYWKK